MHARNVFMGMNEAARAPGTPRYRAFISYSHVDEAMARRLHRWLETYRIPARLVGRTTMRGDVPRRLAPVFRDRAELAASDNLDDEVKAALAQSASLVVLCSPAARKSAWVNEEIAYFRAVHPDRVVLAALLDGEPEQAFPAALVDVDFAGRKREPIAADFRQDGDGKLAFLKLAAGLTGIALDELVQRDAQRQIRRVTAITLAAVAAALVLGLLLIIAIAARHDAERQRQQAEGLIDFMLTDLRTGLQGVGRLDILGAVNARAIAYYGQQGDLARLPGASLERRARILHAMGEDDQKRGDFAAALAKFREAHRVTSALLAADSRDPDRIYTHAQSEFWIGYTDFLRGDYGPARIRFTAYLALARQLVAADAQDPRALRELSYAQGNICSLELATKADPAASLQACRHALAAMMAVAATMPGDVGVQSDLANRHAWMADALVATGRQAEALVARRRQIRIVDRLMATDGKNASLRQDWILARYATALLLHELGRDAEAQGIVEPAIAAIDRLTAADPRNRNWRVWRTKIQRSFPDQQKDR